MVSDERRRKYPDISGTLVSVRKKDAHFPVPCPLDAPHVEANPVLSGNIESPAIRTIRVPSYDAVGAQESV